MSGWTSPVAVAQMLPSRSESIQRRPVSDTSCRPPPKKPRVNVLVQLHWNIDSQSLAIIDLMIPIDPSEIVHWADKPDAQHKLPDLVRRLILATVPMPSLLHMPSGSSIWRPGWDGVFVVENGNAWVPDGTSGWEMSCEKNPKSKAASDYNKRMKDPTATFMFVTPRRWVDKDKWASDRCEENQWADVRVLDADDLVAWLGQAPAVAHWFARLIGKLPATGVVPLDEWWENWSIVANPRISAELVTAGRQDQAERMFQWFRAEPSHYYVQGDTQDEAIAFLAGCAQADERQWGPASWVGPSLWRMLTHGGASKGIHRPWYWCVTSQAAMCLPR